VPLKHISIPPVQVDDPKKSIEVLRQSTEHQVNLLVQQVNQNANKLTNQVDAQNNTITNIAWPVQPGDTVPLRYLESTLGELEKRVQNKIARTQRPPVSGGAAPRVFNVVFKAAIAQNGTPLLGMSFPSSTITGAVVAGTNVLYAVEQFTGGQYVQDHFPLPDDWVPNSQLNCFVYWCTTSGTAAPTWSCQFQGVANAGGLNAAYNSAATIVSTATTSVQLVISTITSIPVTSMLPTQLAMFKFGRSDAGTDTAGLIELRFTIIRNV
jgi:hypothetical protein